MDTLDTSLDTPKLHDITIVIRKTYQCARVEGVPPEEFGSLRTELRGMNERLDRIIEKFAQHA